jgi:molecular chaperone DnaJ
MMDYYSVLGVHAGAAQDDIKKAFRSLAKQCHPDVVPPPEKKAAEERFKLISEAYDVVGDEAKRREYDARRASPFRVSMSMDDIFGAGRRQGPDIRGTIDVPLEDAAYGARRSVSLRRMSGCKACAGSGTADGKRLTCAACGGVGSVFREFGHGFMRVSAQSICPACGGEGTTVVSPCSVCSGRRYAPVDEEIIIDVPCGARSGDSITVPGRGSWGPGGDGNLVVVMRVMSHERFQRDGDDLITTLEMPLRTALAGGEVVLRDLRGDEVRVVVPRPCQHGQEIIIPSRGIRGGSMRVRASFKLPSLGDEEIARMPV